MIKYDKNEIINNMYNFIDDEVKKNIYKPAFTDISNVFIDLYEEYVTQFDQYIKSKSTSDNKITKNEKVKWVCDASMGHGKTTALICFLKWLVSEERPKHRVPVLLVIRENGMADQIYDEMKKFDENCIVRVDSENKKNIEKFIQYFQIVIITHSRLDNLALGYGSTQLYSVWEQYRMSDWNSRETLDPSNFICKRHRLLIVDEKPTFVNHSIFGIDSFDNALDWFNDLSFVLKLQPFQSQILKTQILNLIADQLIDNTSDVTTALMSDRKSPKSKNVLNAIKSIKNDKASRAKIESYKKMIHFEQLCKKDGFGRIDDYEINGFVGRKIIVAKRIDYGKLYMNMLVLDGTAKLTQRQYIGFTIKEVKNYNDYSRLHICQDVINTSKYSREKKGHPTQNAIAERIIELREKHPDLFVLPLKSDIPIYKKLGAIHRDHMDSFNEKAYDDSKPINQLNTTGKNQLNNVTSLYLPSLPRMYADHYKVIAISLYEKDVSLQFNKNGDSNNWFEDKNLELVYLGEMYAELLQIIHRTALRKISDKSQIHIYLAYSQNDKNVETFQPLFLDLNVAYLNKEMNYSYHYVHDESLFGRGDTIRNYLEEIHRWIWNNITFFNQLPKPLSEIGGKGGIGEKFRKWLSKNDNWNNKKELINKIFREKGYVIYENENDKRRTKLISTIEKYDEHKIFGNVG